MIRSIAFALAAAFSLSGAAHAVMKTRHDAIKNAVTNANAQTLSKKGQRASPAKAPKGGAKAKAKGLMGGGGGPLGARKPGAKKAGVAGAVIPGGNVLGNAKTKRSAAGAQARGVDGN